MMIRSGLRTLSLLSAAMVASAAAGAQTSSRYDYPEPDGGAAATGDWAEDASDAQTNRSPETVQAEEDFSDVVASDEQREAAPSRAENKDDRAPQPSYEDDETEKMTNACALAARDEAERDGGYAEVRQMGEPRESRNGFIIDGDVDIRSGWRTQDSQSRHFSCTIANGRIEDVYFQRERMGR